MCKIQKTSQNRRSQNNPKVGRKCKKYKTSEKTKKVQEGKVR